MLLRRHIDLDEDYPDPAHLCPGCGYNDGLRRILRNEPTSRKMKWAAKRTTTREEDAAYCLMDLFDINMPLLYGEGGKAFERLQQKILLNAPDQSILTWVDKPRSVRNTETCLAPRLSAFHVENFNVCHARFAADVERGDIMATNRGLELDVIFGPCVFGSSTAWAPLELFLAVLNCTIEPDNLSRVAIFVKALHPQSSSTAYGRACHDELVILRSDSSPSILSRSYTTDGREIFDLRRKNCVDYDINKFERRKILLSGLASPWDKLGSNTQECPRLKLEIQDCGDWTSKVGNRDLVENGMILMRQNLHQFKGRRIDGMLIYGVLLISNGSSSFFIILGLENYLSIPESNPHYTCWVETWDELMMGERPQSAASSLSEGRLKHAIHQYMERHDRHELRNKRAGISRGDFQVRVEIQLVEFLQRRGYSLTVHIRGWDFQPQA
ncbi:hypothetical protein FALBO_15674 [Fusarium albosuccineum]|uniref:DUF8212 domain-containing protein n=1 Tax=Fusarium albosuccineum TaxID=1237068 RepID=A0A8H4P2Y3_9HYPO|nr:hypothetical protein FALBO_15674 [Fusarium albosuccineum]